MTGPAFAEVVRRQIADTLKDAANDFHVPTSALAAYLTLCFADLWFRQPEAFAVTVIPTSPPVTVTEANLDDANYNLPILDTFDNAAIDFVANKVLTEDAQDNSNREMANDRRVQYAQGLV